MSSILRALKKVQNEAPGKYEFRPWPRQRNIKQTRWKTVSRVISSRLFLAAALLAAAGALWFLFDAKKNSPEPLVHSTPPPAPAVMAPEKIDPPPARPVVEALAAKQKQAAPPAAQAEIPPVSDPQANIPKMDDPSMVLQAIVWDIHPKDRVAVINGDFIGEGDMAGPFRVAAILRSSVLLKGNGDDMWRLTYPKR